MTLGKQTLARGSVAVQIAIVAVLLAAVTSPVPSAAAAATSGAVTGKVTNVHGQGVSGVQVDLELIGCNSIGSQTPPSATTDANGNYSISAVPVGNYQVDLFPGTGFPSP